MSPNYQSSLSEANASVVGNDMPNVPTVKTKCSFKKKLTIEPFMCGSEDKRSCKVEISQLFDLLICSYKKSTLSDLKLFSLKSNSIVQSIPPNDRFKHPSSLLSSDKQSSFIPAKKQLKSKVDESDYIITFTSEDFEEEKQSGIRVITAHSTGLLKEWIVTPSRQVNVQDDVEDDETQPSGDSVVDGYYDVNLRKTWASFHVGHISCLLLAPSDKSGNFDGLLASGGSSDSIIKIWNLKQGYCTHTFKLKAGTISSMAFHSYSDSKDEEKHVIIASGDHSNHIQVFDLLSGNKIGTLDGHISPVTSFQFASENEAQSKRSSVNKTLLISLSRDKLMVIWSLNSMSSVKKIPVFDSIEDSCFIDGKSNDKVILTVGDSGIIRALDLMTGRIIFTQVSSFDDPAKVTPIPLKQVAIWMQSSKTGKKSPTVVSITNNNQICFYKVNLDKKRLGFNYQLVGELDTVLCVKFIGPSNEHLVVASNSNLIKIYSLKHNSCEVLSPIKGQSHEDIVLSIATCPYDPYVFATCSKDNSVIIWRFWSREVKSSKTGEVLRSEFGATALLSGAGHFRSVTSIAWPTKKTTGVLFTGSEDTIIKTWKIPASLHKIEPNDQIDPSKVTVTQLTSYSSVKAHDKDINCLCVSPKDVLFASGSKDKTAKLWTLDPEKKALKLVHTLRGHRKTVWFLDFSPVDKILITASADSSLKIWSLTDYSCIRTFCIDNSSVYLVGKFISNGTQVLSASSNSLIRLWSVKDIICHLTLDPTVHNEVISETTLAKYRADKSRAYGNSTEPIEDEIDTRIWSLDLNSSESEFAFGTGSRVLVYSDSTVESENMLIEEKEVKVVCDQKLSNLLKSKKYGKALAVAIRLNHPSRCLDIMREITLSSSSSSSDSTCGADGVNNLTSLLEGLRDDQLFYLMSKASSKWNTNSKNALIAQVVLKVTLNRMIADLVENDPLAVDLTNIAPIVQAALPYTERHVNRINRLYTSSHFVQFLCDQGMKSLPSTSSLKGKDE